MGCNPLSVLVLDIYLFFILFLYRVSLTPGWRPPASEGRGRGGRPAAATPPGPRLQLRSQTPVF